MNNYQIYTLSDPRTGEIRYVGFTKKELAVRLKNHIKKSKSGTKDSYTHVLNWIKKLSEDNLKPKIETIELCNEDNWKECEKFWIQQLRVWGFRLTNLTDGGDGLSNPSKETREKISFANKGKKRTPEQIELHRQTIIGRKLSEEHKKKISLTSPRFWKGKKMSEFAKQKMSISKTGYKHSEETKTNISINNSRYWAGKNMSEETKQKLRNSSKRKSIDQFTKEGKFIRTWDSISQASRETHIQKIHIISCCKGKSKSAGGFFWSYK